jgi:undecaprenyl pyrophosphate phosphatase UppP
MFANFRLARFVALASRSGAALATERAVGAYYRRACDFSFTVVRVTVVRITAGRIISSTAVR